MNQPVLSVFYDSGGLQAQSEQDDSASGLNASPARGRSDSIDGDADTKSIASEHVHTGAVSCYESQPARLNLVLERLDVRVSLGCVTPLMRFVALAGAPTSTSLPVEVEPWASLSRAAAAASDPIAVPSMQDVVVV
jgi:hypothetical protein